MTRKRNSKLDKPIAEIAHTFATKFIASYGIVEAEIIAKLVLEKIRANKRSLERKYGRKK